MTICLAPAWGNCHSSWLVQFTQMIPITTKAGSPLRKIEDSGATISLFWGLVYRTGRLVSGLPSWLKDRVKHIQTVCLLVTTFTDIWLLVVHYINADAAHVIWQHCQHEGPTLGHSPPIDLQVTAISSNNFIEDNTTVLHWYRLLCYSCPHHDNWMSYWSLLTG